MLLSHIDCIDALHFISDLVSHSVLISRKSKPKFAIQIHMLTCIPHFFWLYPDFIWLCYSIFSLPWDFLPLLSFSKCRVFYTYKHTVVMLWCAVQTPLQKWRMISPAVGLFGNCFLPTESQKGVPPSQGGSGLVVSNSFSPGDCSLPGSSVHGISQARILEWVAISFSRASFQPRDGTQVSRVASGFFTIWATKEASSHGNLYLL